MTAGCIFVVLSNASRFRERLSIPFPSRFSSFSLDMYPLHRPSHLLYPLKTLSTTLRPRITRKKP